MPLANAAIDYYPAAYTTGGERLMGREAAGEGFLNAFLRHAEVDRFYCFTGQQADFEQFVASVRGAAGDKPAHWIPRSEPARLASAGCLFHPDPVLRGRAWERRHHDETAYSLCGVTHTICTAAVMDAIGALLTDPLYPWDALICTSSVVKSSVERMLGHWSEYLVERLGARLPMTVELPIIPLGVDCTSFDDPAADQHRRELRAELGIGDREIVVLYMGRLVFHAKAHPLPMFQALEEAARPGKTVTLIQAGWFPNAAIEAEFKTRGQAAAPSIKTIYVDGRRADYRRKLWHAADIFVSLADNIQETFGLSPIEAMAAGLPVVVSDWDGYRDTVRHGTDGFRIPTVMAPAGCGNDLALRYALGDDDYDRYIGTASLCTAVDVAECTQAFVRLFADEGLRRSMGASGKQRAREHFDWKHVVRAYQHLWHELATRRSRAAVRQRPTNHPANPLREDPFALFATYPTAQLGEHSIVTRLGSDFERRLARLYELPMMNFAPSMFSTLEESRRLVASLATGPQSVGELLAPDGVGRRRLERTLVWLAKAGLVRIVPQSGIGRWPS